MSNNRRSRRRSSSRGRACSPRVRENNQVPATDILGPFPDETILAGIDRAFFLLGVNRMRTFLNLPQSGYESDIRSSSTDFSRSCGDHQKEIKPCRSKTPSPVGTCGPSAATCKPAAVTCKPAATFCKPAAVTCKPAAVTCKPAAVTCKPAAATCAPSAATCKPPPKRLPSRGCSPKQVFERIKCCCKKCCLTRLKPDLKSALSANYSMKKPNSCKNPQKMCVTQEATCKSVSKSRLCSGKDTCPKKPCNQPKCCNTSKTPPSCNPMNHSSKPPGPLKANAGRRCMSNNVKTDTPVCTPMKRSFSLCSLICKQPPPPINNTDTPIKEGSPKWMWTRQQNYSDGSKIFEIFQNSNVSSRPCGIDFEDGPKLMFVMKPNYDVIPFETLACHK